MAEETGEDIISTVQGFGLFRHGTPPTPANVGRALWGTCKLKDGLTSLYNVFPGSVWKKSPMSGTGTWKITPVAMRGCRLDTTAPDLAPSCAGGLSSLFL
jgi:hypothetical protein